MEIRNTLIQPTLKTTREHRETSIFRPHSSSEKDPRATFEPKASLSELSKSSFLKSDKINSTTPTIYPKMAKSQPFSPQPNHTEGLSQSRMAIATYRSINQQAEEPQPMLVLNRVDTFA